MVHLEEPDFISFVERADIDRLIGGFMGPGLDSCDPWDSASSYDDLRSLLSMAYEAGRAESVQPPTESRCNKCGWVT